MAKLRNGFQPMHALYHRNVFPSWKALIQAQELKIHQLADHPVASGARVTPEEFGGIDPEGRSFYNVNTPADLRGRTIARGQGKRPSSS